MTRLRPLRASIAILAAGVVLAALICTLPQNTYQRWRLLDGTLYYWTKWIYERCHFDPTPIDVAIIGPSKTLRGVDAPRLGRELAARGLPGHVVNFSIPKTGRNANYVIVRELLRQKQPKVIIVGIMDRAYDYGHPSFKYIAPAKMVVSPSYLTNMNYLSDLLYLPYRQLILFFANVAPDLMGIPKSFDPRHYLGVSADTTADFVLPDGTVVEGRPPLSSRQLAIQEREWEATVPRPLFGVETAPVQFGDERHFVRLIADAAKARGVKIIFLYIPNYIGTSKIQDQRFYEQVGPVLNATFVANHPEWYANLAHLNRAGARELTDWLVGPIASMLGSADPPTAKTQPAAGKAT